MVDNLFSQIIPLTAAMALPFPVIKATRYLLGGKPFTHSLFFILTWGITILLVIGLSVILKAYLYVIFGIIINIRPVPGFTGWVQIVFGSLFIGMGVKKLRQGMEKKDRPAAQLPLEISPVSIITATLKTQLFKLKNTMLLALIVYLFLSSTLTLKQSFVASAMISLTAMIWVSMPLLVYCLRGEKKDQLLGLLKGWLQHNGSTLIIFIYIFVGISILSSGIGLLIPYLLATIFEAVT